MTTARSGIAALLLVSGAAIGPHGLAILTPSVLSFLDPAAPVGLAIFGIIAVMRVARGRTAVLAVAPAALQATMTGLVVAAAFIVARPAIAASDLFPAWSVAAVVLGIAAATSSSLAWRDGDAPDAVRHTGTDDALVPIVAGAWLLAFARSGTAPATLLLSLQAVAVTTLVAASGWLLLTRASTTEEQRVCTFGSVLLLGGAADYLSMSALVCGLAGGAVWRFASGAIREHIRRDVTYAADSLLALVLLLAGAHADYSPAAVAIALGYTVLRAAGKLAGDRIAGRLFPASPRPATRLLLAPGAFGVAFALNVVRALGVGFSPVLTIVVAGTIASSVVAALTRGEAEA